MNYMIRITFYHSYKQFLSVTATEEEAELMRKNVCNSRFSGVQTITGDDGELYLINLNSFDSIQFSPIEE